MRRIFAFFYFMDIALQKQTPEECYQLLASLIVPRPIAWVSTLNFEGKVNLAPYSFFNIMRVRPPIVAFAPGNKKDGSPKDTACHLERTGEFVVNLVSESLADVMAASAKPYPMEISEVEQLGVKTKKSSVIKVPFIESAPVSLECQLIEVRMIGQNRLVIGEIVYAHLQEGAFQEEGGYTAASSPIGRMASPNHYCRTHHGFQA